MAVEESLDDRSALHGLYMRDRQNRIIAGLRAVDDFLPLVRIQVGQRTEPGSLGLGCSPMTPPNPWVMSVMPQLAQ